MSQQLCVVSPLRPVISAPLATLHLSFHLVPDSSEPLRTPVMGAVVVVVVTVVVVVVVVGTGVVTATGTSVKTKPLLHLYSRICPETFC